MDDEHEPSARITGWTVLAALVGALCWLGIVGLGVIIANRC